MERFPALPAPSADQPGASSTDPRVLAGLFRLPACSPTPPTPAPLSPTHHSHSVTRHDFNVSISISNNNVSVGVSGQVSRPFACIYHFNIPVRPSLTSAQLRAITLATRKPATPTNRQSNMSDHGNGDGAGAVEHLNIKVTDNNNEVFFKIKRNTRLEKLMRAFCDRQGKKVESVRFLFEGSRVQMEDTPDTVSSPGPFYSLWQEANFRFTAGDAGRRHPGSPPGADRRRLLSRQRAPRSCIFFARSISSLQSFP